MTECDPRLPAILLDMIARDHAPDPDGDNCLVCQAVEEMTKALDDRDRYRAALVAIDRMNPDDFKGGQGHLSPAFREPSLPEVMRFVCRTVNGVLHGTDEHGRPLP